jgi:hypothetical protein
LENVQLPHGQPLHPLHAAHTHHPAQAQDGHHRGSEQESEKHKASTGESDPLVHHLKRSDWQEQAVKHKSRTVSEKGHLPDLEINGHDKLQQSLSNAKLAPADRLEAARHLIDDGVHSMHFKDQQGKDHDYRIQLFNSGKVRVSEGGQTVVQDAGMRTATDGGAQTFAKLSDRSVEKLTAKPAAKSSESHSERSPGASATGSAQQHHQRRPSGLTETAGGQYKYENPSGGRSMAPGPGIDSHAWKGVKNPDGSVTIGFTGCEVDTDGKGASRHGEDGHRRSTTSLTRSDGSYLDTDKDNFVVLSPSVAKAYGIHLGDLGWLVRKDTGEAVPVVFGDTGHEGRRSAEASVAAIKGLHYRDIDGNNGVTGGQFEIVLAKGSGNGTGDIARNPQAIANKLQGLTQVASAD